LVISGNISIGDSLVKLGLGTAQFGLNYGVTNFSGQTNSAIAKEILATAEQAGMQVLDTASAYGNSESIIGNILGGGEHNFRIITKTSSPAKNSQRICADALVSVRNSLKRLRQKQVYGVLIHSPDDLLKRGGEELFKALQIAKEEKLAEKIGVSVYTSEQIDALLQLYPIDLIQLPFNLFDQRLLKSGHLHKLKEANIEVHARSVFLQGLLLAEPDLLPPYFDPHRAHIADYQNAVHAQRLSLAEAALGFALHQTTIDAIIFGVNDVSQLIQLLAVANKPPSEESLLPLSRFSSDNNGLIDPSTWLTNTV
jgi:aryl-alcohol dehydrogenase-like predicted oxidoreductase